MNSLTLPAPDLLLLLAALLVAVDDCALRVAAGPVDCVVVRVLVEGRVVVTRVPALVVLDVPVPDRFEGILENVVSLVGVTRFLSSSLLVLPDDL